MKNVDFLNDSIIAYRGIYNNITVYENSLEAIMYAVKNKLSIFIDIAYTKDKKIIVFSEKDIARLLKVKDKMSSMNKEDIDYISSYYIPTLDEVLDKVDGKVSVIINLDIDNKSLRKNIINILSKYKGNVVIVSSQNDILKHYNSKITTGLIIGKNNKDLLNKDIGTDILLIKYDLVDENKLKFIKEMYYIIGYTVDNRELAEKYIKLFNNLIIDNIEEVFK